MGLVTPKTNTPSGSNLRGHVSGTKFAYTGIGASTLSNNISLSSGNGTIANSSGSALTLNGNLSDNGSLLTLASGTFNVGGSITGAYALSNATANLTGQTYGSSSASLLAGSTLNLGGNNNLTTAAALNFGATTDIATQTNTLNLDGYNQSVASISSLGGSGVNQIVDNSAFGGGTFSILGNSTFSGSIGGLTTTASQRNLNLTVGSGANVNLTGKNTYTGNTTIQKGAVLDLGGWWIAHRHFQCGREQWHSPSGWQWTHQLGGCHGNPEPQWRHALDGLNECYKPHGFANIRDADPDW